MKNRNQSSCLPDLYLSLFREIKPDEGEDSYCYSFGNTCGLLAVFDGCGGLGAQRHSFYSGKTEAYMASRMAAGVFYDCFCEMFPAQGKPAELANNYAAAVASSCEQVFSVFRPQLPADAVHIRGSMVRTLPSTAAAVLIQPSENGSFTLSPIWAGDSRVYLLTPEGLSQLTQDDTTVPDPMDNLYEDGILRNIICQGHATRLHTRSINVSAPFLVFTATDGCFGYLSTPMEFEGVLLETLLSSSCAAHWEQLLAARLGRVAGDDHTLCLAAFGFSSLSDLKARFAHRYEYLRQSYLLPLQQLPNTDRISRQTMWQSYKPQYSRYLKEE